MIRSMRLCDIPHCLRIVEDNWGKSVAERTMIQLHYAFNSENHNPPTYFVYEHNNQVVAFAGLMESQIMHGIWDFIWINIRKDYQRQDIGTEMARYRIDYVRRHGGTAIHLMTQKPGFFQRFGFHSSREYVDNVAPRPENPWILMTLQLGEVTLK